MYIITSKLNSTLEMIGIATGFKRTAKLYSHFSMKN